MQINKKFSSPNFSPRIQNIKFIVLHYTEMSFIGALNRLRDPVAKVSAHYLIKEDGEIFQLVDDTNIAWHAGVSSWKGLDKINECSIGIELDNLGQGQFRSAQLNSCIELCQKLVDKYNIPANNIIGHSDIAPARKIDPGIYFDWQYLASNGLGMWHDIALASNNSILFKSGDESIEVAELQNNLKKLGYNIEITRFFDQQTNFVVRAFQSHFYSQKLQSRGVEFYRDDNSEYEWDNNSNMMLMALLQKLAH